MLTGFAARSVSDAVQLTDTVAPGRKAPLFGSISDTSGASGDGVLVGEGVGVEVGVLVGGAVGVWVGVSVGV